MIQPFADDDILFQSIPEKDTGPAYVIVNDGVATGGIRVYCRAIDYWHEAGFNESKIVVTLLLQERSTLTADNERLWAAADTMQHEWFVKEREYERKIDILIAERDAYRRALERYETGKYYEGIHAAKALAQGAKIRGEE